MSESETDRLDRIAKRFQELARSTNLPVLVLSQEVTRLPTFERPFTSAEMEAHLSIPLLWFHRSRLSGESEGGGE